MDCYRDEIACKLNWGPANGLSLGLAVDLADLKASDLHWAMGEVIVDVIQAVRSY